MAKIRRVVRKVQNRRGDYFDEQLWPIYIALVVLGGFLMGISAAYLKFSGVPWYASAWTSLTVVPLVVVGFMVAFRYVDNRWLRRSMQLSIVICAILHVALVVQMIETRLFGHLFEQVKEEREVVAARPRRVINEYHPSQLLPEEDRPRQDFEEPVEIETPQPQPEPEQIVRQESPERVTPQLPQPVPVPEPERTTEPNVVRQPRPNEAAPRQAAEASKLSRQLKPSDVKVSQVLDTPAVAQTPTAGVQANASRAPIERRQAESTIARTQTAEPTTTTPTTTPQVARRAESSTRTPEASATPTLPRNVARPAATPRTQVAAAETPSPARETSPAEVRPANTASTQRTTTSPSVARAAVAEPTPDVSREPTSQPQRRENPAEAAPAVAAAPSPVPSRQPRATARPDATTTAAAVAPAPAASDAPSSEQVAPRTTQIERTAATVTSARASDVPAAQPRSANEQQPALQIVRAEGREAPAATANPSQSPTLTRRTGAPSLPTTSQAAEAAAGAVVATTSSAEVSPSSTATRRQESASPQASRTSGEPAPAQLASASTEAPRTPGLARRASAANESTADAPNAAAQPGAVATNSRSPRTAVANVVTTVSDVPANAGPQTAEGANPGPSSASISRQTAATSAGATRTQPNLAAPSQSPSSQLARGGATRSQASEAPSISTATAGGSPRRAVASAAAASSPTNVESPAAAVAATGTGEPAHEPARMALTRSLDGTAGAGRSANVDSSLPGGNSPALVASGAARRAEATQQAPSGDALSPSSPARIARSRAGADVPSSSLQAQPVDVASTGGGETAELTASASAALTRADAAARAGDVTAAKGTGEVDLGPTQTIAEAGIGRASGGGQSQLNFDTQSPQLARSTASGGAPLVALATPEVGDVAAPTATGGGQPAPGEPSPQALAAARTIAGGAASASGGPSAAQQAGPLAEANTASLLADSPLSRADAAEGQSGGQAAGGEPAVEDEEERARLLARATSGGAPQLAMAGPLAADVAVTPPGDGGDAGAAAAEPAAASTLAARQQRDGGAPAGGSPLAGGEPAAAAAGGAAAIGNLTIARAEASDGAPDEVALGGGTSSPAKAAQGPSFAATTAAEEISIAGAPNSGGAPDGAPVEAQGIEASRLAGGATGPIVDGPIGALSAPDSIDASAPGVPGDGIGRRQSSPAEEGGPAIESLANHGAPGRRASKSALVGGATTVAEIPEVGPQSAVAQAELDHMLSGVGNTPMSRQAGQSLSANVEAPEGPGGLGAEYTPEVGLNTRQARADSLQVQLRTARFARTNVGGLPSVSTTALAPTDAFSTRSARIRGMERGGGKGAPSPQTEEAIEMGLAFLARHQMPDGGWSLQGYPEGAQLSTDTAATALALLAFQGAGYNHREHQYKDAVAGGLEFLIKSQKENGDLYVPLDTRSNNSVWLYSHSLAALALCEAYGMTQDPQLKEPAQKAVDFIVAAQQKERGGWRYAPGVGADTSVTGWMIMALKSGELAGLDVPTETFAGVNRWLDRAQHSPSQPHLYRYNPDAPDTPEQRHGRVASKTMTSVGLLMRLYTGWRRDNPHMARGAAYLRENLPALGTPRQPLRDTYYWYYATQVMSHMGGEHWRAWNAQLHPLLVNSQVRTGPLAGSWDPGGSVPDRWGPMAGRLYVTTLNLLSLEVQYRKLPLYEDTAK